MTQELKDKALDILTRCTVDGTKLRLPDGHIDTEVWTIVKDALLQAGCQYNKKTEVFIVAGPLKAIADAKAWLQEQEVNVYDAPALYNGPISVEAEEEPSEEEEKKKKQVA